jgi:type II secretory pathway pseudopilin PulG
MNPLNRHHPGQRARGSSTLEIVTLIVIFGLLAAVAFPIFERMREIHRNNRFEQEIRRVIEALTVYATENDGYPDSPGPGVAPEGMEGYLSGFDWSAPTPFGGEWEWVNNRFGVRAAIAVLDPDVSEDHLERFDTAYDNGDLETGQYRFISEIRYAYVLEGGEPRNRADGESANQ